jgi:hypothetical protein
MIVAIALALWFSAPHPSPGSECKGELVMSLALDTGGSFSIELPYDLLTLHGQANGRGGWFVDVFKRDGVTGSETKIDGTHLDLDAMNWPDYSSLINLPIQGTGRCLNVCFVHAKILGHGGASASFAKGSFAEFRINECPGA